jgi:hypothetical protein
LQQPAIAQVHRVLGQIETAGGWGAGDLPVVLDVERADNRAEKARRIVASDPADGDR